MAIEPVAYIEDGNPLHSLDLNCHLPNVPWVIFIHGGAWYQTLLEISLWKARS